MMDKYPPIALFAMIKKSSLITIILVFLSSCVNLRHDITNNKNAWYPYQIDREYVLTEDVFLMEVDSELEPKRFALVPVSDSNRRGGLYSSPKSIIAYEENPVQASRIYHEYGYFEVIVIGIVKAGTTFQPSRLMQNAGVDLWFGNHTYNTMYGTINNGPFKNKEVDIQDISRFMQDAPVLNRYVKINF